MIATVFNLIAAGQALSDAAAHALDEDGFAVIAGPVDVEELPSLVAAYDTVMATADPADRNTGRGSTTRVHDFVNRDAIFDPLYLHPPVLEACCGVIRRPFKLSTLLGRTLNPHSPAQGLHMDFPPEAADRAAGAWPMLGFILMLNDFHPDNGATRFVPRSHRWPDPPRELPVDDSRQVPAVGPAGSVILYNGSAWHGHGANLTGAPRRSIQGAFIRRDAQTGGLSGRMRGDTLARLGALARYLLAVDE